MAERLVTDRFRQAVYRAEDQWSATLDRGGEVDFFGSRLQVPTQLRFGSLEHARTYVDDVCNGLSIDAPTIRHRKGGKRAHYSDGEIAIPTDQPWAMRESVVLHEIAHHVSVRTAADHTHSAVFAGSMLSLVELRLGPEAGLLLRTGYQAAGVPVQEMQ